MSTPLTAVQFFKTWWFLIATLSSLTVGGLTFGIDLSLRVDQLAKKQQVDDLQWLNIRANTRQGITHQGKISAMEVHMQPDNILRWGRVAAGWEEDHQALNDHLRRHD